jgi:hypothetical protein
MTVLEIGRLHARYDGSAAGTTTMLDDALRRVAESGLAHELISHRLHAAHAVCIRRLSLRVRLDPGQPVAALSRRWAAAIVAALEDRLAEGGDVVVYRREVDALVDVVRSAAAGDRARTWAWHQIGLVAPSVPWLHPSDLADVLGRHPHLVPATIAASRRLAARAIDAPGWVRLAHLVRAAVDGPRVVEPAGPMSRAAGGWPASVDEARALVPAAAWAASAGPDDRVALAVLALACVAPARCRDPHTVRLVASTSAGGEDPPRPARILPPPGDDGSDDPGIAAAAQSLTGPGGHVDGPGSAVATAPEAAPAERPRIGAAAGGPTSPASQTSTSSSPSTPAAPMPGGDDPDPVVSSHGGVLFLVHAVTDLDLPSALVTGPLGAHDTPAVLARVLAAAAAVEPDDPAVLAAAGWRSAGPTDALAAPLLPEHEEQVAAHARRLRAWVASRLGDEPDADLAWVWARRAAIDAQPGWVEATFALDDVDLRLRVAGLDLDPGVVWWQGGVVRFRYV